MTGGLDITIDRKEYVVDYLVNAFPTRAMEIYTDDEGFKRSRPAFDADGNPLLSAEAENARADMIEQLCALPAVSAALAELVRHFGTDEVAEVTGRTKRLITDKHGDQKIESRSARTNLAETSAFMDGAKRINIYDKLGDSPCIIRF